MDRLTSRLAEATSTLAKLEDLLASATRDEVSRDAAIKRFELSFETAWKAAQAYLIAVEGLEVASPKSVIRQCRLLGVLSVEDAERALALADDRNLASQTYDPTLANALAERLPAHARILSTWLAAIGSKLTGP